MRDTVSEKSLAALRLICCVLFVGVFTYYIIDSWHWPLVWDSSVMHYIRFMITRGLHPYSDITDMNLPGCYLVEGWAMAVFGWSDLSWRIYEFFLIAMMAVSGMVIGGNRRWFAGVYAVIFFIVMQGAEGPIFAVERDEVMLVLLMTAMASFFLAMRRQTALLMLPFGFLAALATTLKPGAVVFDFLLLLLALLHLRRTDQKLLRYVLWWLCGNLLVVAIVLLFLQQHHAFRGLLFIVQTVWPAYSHTRNEAQDHLWRHLVPVAIMPLIVLGLIIAGLRRGRVGWEQGAIFIALATGAFSYFAQGKGAPYHRYMFITFVVFWIGWELVEAMHRSELKLRWMGASGVAILFLVVVPHYIAIMQRYAHSGQNPASYANALEADLIQLGGDRLQRQAQCLDLTAGCLNALYHLRLLQNTGATGDLLLFSPTSGPDVDYYRHWYLDTQSTDPAQVIVLGNEWYQERTLSFDLLGAWPEYADYLGSHYELVADRHFGANPGGQAYRIYLRKGSPVLAWEQADPLR